MNRVTDVINVEWSIFVEGWTRDWLRDISLLFPFHYGTRFNEKLLEFSFRVKNDAGLIRSPILYVNVSVHETDFDDSYLNIVSN